MKRKGLVLAAVAGAVLLGGWGAYAWLHRKGPEVKYRTAKVERGDVVNAVRATGTVQPIQQVQVGTQVNGPILKLNADYNSVVKAGDIVAQIDPSVYEARVAQDRANLQQAEASVEQARAKLLQADKELERTQKLAKLEMVPVSELETAAANRDVCAAQVRLDEASVSQARATLRVSQANLDYTTIRSPVDGVVIARNVNAGQTVVASMTAQTIFLVATDLSRVQVEASVPEADIGGVQEGQPVAFTVDAYDREFTGSVTQVRLASTSVQNVVTYPVIITAENPERKLFPGMTASISCEISRTNDVLKIPNAALRFQPELAAKTNSQHRAAGKRKPGHRAVWVNGATGPSRVEVRTGISDGSFTAVTGDGLAEGDEVITGMLDGSAAPANGTVNPFVPRMPARRGMR